ncbi:VOC family protein [Acetobacter persici]|uniref:VOC family protein n=1 Tax=Acetobacter persici TaxID=1076596 RepID=UPI0039ECC1E2
MALCGIDAVIFGVQDMEAALRFVRDWGLHEKSVMSDQIIFETRDGCEVIVKPVDAPDLPAAIEAGNTVREVVWGAQDQAALDDTLARLGDAVSIGADGLARATDPNGLSLVFRVTHRHVVAGTPTMPNAPGAYHRIDTRGPVITQANPIQIGHIVLFGADFAAMRAFYTERLGFVVSDEYPGHGCFMRCQVKGGHHNLFVLNRPGKAGINHVAFTLNDIHEVVGGGLAMSRKGWKTEIGPGRHPISSAYFWYFENPLAAPLEYYADEDYCTEAWEARVWERRPENFAEWAVAGGIDGETRRQKIGGQDSSRGHKK